MGHTGLTAQGAIIEEEDVEQKAGEREYLMMQLQRLDGIG